MLKRLALITTLAALAAQPRLARAQSNNCVNTYYQTHDAACLDRMVAAAATPPMPGRPDNTANSLVGFFGALFERDPAAMHRILADQTHQHASRIYLAALVRADLTDEARRYADTIGAAQGLAQYTALRLPTIEQLIPDIKPGDNDMLIGAYMASGNRTYITHALDNYLTADDAMATVAFRKALVTSKFGAALTPPGRKNTMIPALCSKYNCKQNPHDLLRVLTLSTALWAIQSLAQQDAGIRQSLKDFLHANPRLNADLLSEENAFSNYITMLLAYAGIKDNPGINSSLTIYEQLGTPADVLAAMRTSGNAITPHPHPTPQ